MTSIVSPPAAGRRHRRPAAVPLLAVVLAVALGLRLAHLGLYGYQPDEIWTAEIEMGRGSSHLEFPRNQVIPAPVLFDLARAAPWWHVWTHLPFTSPPLYYVLLRWWMDAFGMGDAVERSLSVVLSVLAVGVLFDVVRLLSGTRPAVWAAVLMTLAVPQVAHAQLTRNYAILMLVALATADALVRIEVRGLTRRRLAALGLAVLATLLTHYFAAGTLVALFAYACVRLRGRTRWWSVAAFVAAGVVYAVVWGPYFWEQRQLFTLTNDATFWLYEPSPWHLRWTLQRFLSVPAATLVQPQMVRWVPVGAVAGALFVLPWLALRRRPDLLLWALWLVATPGMLLLIDLARSSAHLHYVRYTLLSGPAVYALLATLPAAVARPTPRCRWAADALPAAAALACLAALPRAYAADAIVDPYVIQRQFQPVVHRDDLFVFIATGNLEWAAGENYLLVSRYFHPAPGRVAFLDRWPAPPAVQQEVRRHPRVLVFTKTEDARVFLPGMVVQEVVDCPGRGMIWTLTPPAPGGGR